MIIGSFNIRGGGNKAKRKRIGQIVSKGKPNVFLLQESKLDFVNAEIIKGLWPNEEVGWSFLSSSRAFGWLITMWKIDSVEFVSSFRGEGFLGIKILHKGLYIYIFNVYYPCDTQLKRKLWQDLIHWKNKFSDGEWCL